MAGSKVALLGGGTTGLLLSMLVLTTHITCAFTIALAATISTMSARMSIGATTGTLLGAFPSSFSGLAFRLKFVCFW